MLKFVPRNVGLELIATFWLINEVPVIVSVYEPLLTPVPPSAGGTTPLDNVARGKPFNVPVPTKLVVPVNVVVPLAVSYTHLTLPTKRIV